MSECFKIQALLLINCAFVGINNKLCQSIVCKKLILVHMCAFVANVITYIYIYILHITFPKHRRHLRLCVCVLLQAAQRC